MLSKFKLEIKILSLPFRLIPSAFFLFLTGNILSQNFDIQIADQLAQLPIRCIQNEYPNKPGHVLSSDSCLLAPSEEHPAFYGCFDWHSSVHGHWMLVKLIKEFPDLPSREKALQMIFQNISKENIEKEVEFFKGENATYERTYGWAWLLLLSAELKTWDSPVGHQLYKNLKPLTDLIAIKFSDFIPRLAYPIRVGEHSNSAFAFNFALDYAKTEHNDTLAMLIINRSRDFYFQDQNCPVSWEPSGFDFLSPCLCEALLMSKVLREDEFKIWIKAFLPQIKLSPAVVKDESDGKLVHLNGLNLSRAWALYELAKCIDDKEMKSIADKHLEAGMKRIESGSYAGEHWLASFAVYAWFSK